MFEFEWPWMGALLLLPYLVGRFWPLPPVSEPEPPEGQRTTLLHPALEHLQHAFRSRSPGIPLTAWLFRLLIALLWISLVVALMRPQWLEPRTELKTAGYDLMLAVDASHSMDALDFSVDGRQVSRMAVIKGVMGRFVDGREGDRIGLTIFGSQAFVLSPLSLDRGAVRQLLDSVIPSIAGQGTAMGDAIALAVKKLRERPPGSRVLMLIADGENTAGTVPPIEAAKLAAREGVRIYSIGVGSNMESVPIVENGRLITRDDLGFDEDLLRRIAQLSGGAYFRGTDTRALEEIYERIDELEKTEAESRTVMIPRPLYRWPLGLALIMLLILGMFPDGKARILRRMARG